MKGLRTTATREAHEAVLEVTAARERFEFVAYESGQAVLPGELKPLDEDGQVVADDAGRIARRGLTWRVPVRACVAGHVPMTGRSRARRRPRDGSYLHSRIPRGWPARRTPLARIELGRSRKIPDRRHGDPMVRLSTRGMRRFGAVDLELDGLPADPQTLQRASDFLVGLAFVMIRDGEVDRSGFAVEVDDVIKVNRADAQQAYSGTDYQVPRCKTCPQSTVVHLIERSREDIDTSEHVVARVVAPRATSDAPAYDHQKWVRDMLDEVFGESA